MTFSFNPLVILLIIPILGFLALLLVKSDQKALARRVALGFSLVAFLASLWVLARFDRQNGGLQMQVVQPWFTMGNLPVQFNIAVDGISLTLRAGETLNWRLAD